MISVLNLVKEYSDDGGITRALNGVSFDIPSGEFVAVMGPSGSGKSTLLHILSLLDRPSSGRYAFMGRDSGELDDLGLARIRSRKMGFVFQSFNLLSRSSAYENVELPFLYSEKIPPARRRERILEALESVGLGHKAAVEAGRLSGGEKQRVAIARALVNDPAVIFADEPTGNLDSGSGKQVMEILAKLNDSGKTIILVTHETSSARYARRVIRLKDGRIESDGVAEREEAFWK